ncbi:MAG: HTH-type transcriptional activator IlvY [Proteobacteria bacterium]|nr:HTH-type transcriptional activator IlvY [Pseudomonadota bacterium]MBU1687798.1 HTH-type transcriptional activator IlvY [Pseudomonadota bacterium]
MDIRALELFRHLATSLHFGRTSQALNISPSALTRAIQRLEEGAGAKLFYRDNRTVRLTPAGERFRQYTEDSLQQWRLLQQDLAAGETILQGDITIYCSVTAVYGILPRILGQFRLAHPEVTIHLQTGDAASALHKLQSGEVEVAIAALPEKMPPRIRYQRMMETPLLFIASGQGHEIVPEANGGEIDWSRTPLIMAERGVERQRLDNWFKKRGIAPNIYAQVAGNEAIIAMVSLGCGIGLVPALVLEKSPLREEIVTLNIDPPLPPLAVGVCIHEKNSEGAVVQAFFHTAEDESQKYV